MQKARPRQPSTTRKRRTSTSLALVRLSDVKTEEVSWLWKPYIPRGKVTSIEGDPGIGKSWLSVAMAAAVSKGQPLPGQTNAKAAGRVLMLSAEDGLGDTIRPRLEALGANLEHIVALDEPITLDANGLPRLEAAIAETKPSIVFIDPLVAYAGGKLDLHRANEVRVLMRALAQLASTHNCAIVTIRHLRKSRGGAAIYQGQGSIDITAASRSVLMVGRDNGISVMAHAKSNLAPFGPSLAFAIDNGRFRWKGEVRTTADDLAAEPDDRDKRGATDEAMDFLREVLAKGPVPSVELENAAGELGIALRTLRRARQRLGVKTRQFEGHWFCSLPSDDRMPEAHKIGPLAA